VAAAAAAANLTVPYIALAMGAEGRMSRVLNVVLTPVTHPALPSVAAPGQLSVNIYLSLSLSLSLYLNLNLCL